MATNLATGLRAAAAVAAVVALASCAAEAPVRRSAEYLDEATGATVTRASQPLVLYSEDPARAANARDYIYAAPLSVNQSGRHAWWLWLALWSSIDRGATDGELAQGELDGIQLLVDGEPMELDLAAGVASVPGIGRVPYEAPVATAKVILVPLTESQVARIGRAQAVELRVRRAGEGTQAWQPWSGDGGSLKAFAAVAATG